MSKYRATGKVTGHPNPNIKLEAEASSYEELVSEMERKTSDIRFYTEGVNSYTHLGATHESYTKDLIWPEVRWSITKHD